MNLTRKSGSGGSRRDAVPLRWTGRSFLIAGVIVSCMVQSELFTAASPGATPLNDYSFRTNLLVYQTARGEVMPVRSRGDWRKRRAQILDGMQAVMGPLPGKEKRSPLVPRVEEEKDCGAYIQRYLTYVAEPGARVPAYLLVPKNVIESRRRAPAVLVLHPTDLAHGHRSSVEQVNQKYRAYARELVERGFVVLAPSYPLMANYQPDLKALGYQSGTMLAIHNNRRGLDLLDSLPFVKRGKYGVLGHSLGGHNAIYTAVFDDRIQVVVSSCGFDSFLEYYGGNPENWQRGRGWCQDRYMPKLADYRGRLEDIPFDFYELLGALAPRHVFINAPLADKNFQCKSVQEIVGAAKSIYRLHGAEARLEVEHPACEHDFPYEQRERAYRLLESVLR